MLKTGLTVACLFMLCSGEMLIVFMICLLLLPVHVDNLPSMCYVVLRIIGK